MATALLEQIYQNRAVRDREGKEHKLHSEITRDEGKLIGDLIREHRITRTLEIGCAFGISSLFICQALAEQPNPTHTIIDPAQNTYWKRIGIDHLRRAGYSFFELIEEASGRALPRLVEEKRLFQFALIDGYHTFDQVLVDFFYVDQLLEIGGIVVLDDLQLPAIHKVARYIAGYPTYQVVAHARQSIFPPSWRRKAFEWPLRMLARMLPRDYAARVFDDSFLRPDASLGLISEMVALRKTGNDARDSHWYAPF
jgi:predicted O-methyltransferase YrrM